MVLPYNTFTQGIDSRSYASEEMEWHRKRLVGSETVSSSYCLFFQLLSQRQKEIDNNEIQRFSSFKGDILLSFVPEEWLLVRLGGMFRETCSSVI